jgi:hypothetical protein
MVELVEGIGVLTLKRVVSGAQVRYMFLIT